MKDVYGIGLDSEYVPINADGSYGSAIGRIGGSKKHPLKVRNGALQEDCTAGEINIEPALGITPENIDAKIDEAIFRVHDVLAQMVDMIGPVAILSSVEYEKEILMSYGPAAMQFGCDPDFSAWVGARNTPPSPYTTLRTFSGHPHISYTSPSMRKSAATAKLCDVYMGASSVLLDEDTRRRELYGKAGCFRPKPYGMEYRTLSNFWMKDDASMRWVFKSIIRAADNSDDCDGIVEAVGGGDMIQACINNNDKALAEQICNRVEVLNVA